MGDEKKIELTPKQEKFALLVAEGNTYSDAYRGAYNVGEKTLANTIYVKSSKLMDMDKISTRVKELRENAAKESEVTLAYVLNKLAELLEFNLKDIFNDDGTMKGIHELTDSQAACIAQYECNEQFITIDGHREMVGYLKKVKITDRLGVIDKWLRKFGAYINTNVNLETDDLSHVREVLTKLKENK